MSTPLAGEASRTLHPQKRQRPHPMLGSHRSQWRQRSQRRQRIGGGLIDHGPMLTPLLDIMFLVLVFFMVHNSPAQHSIEVDVEPPYMPGAPIAEDAAKLLVSVRADMGYSIELQNGQPVRQWSGPNGSDALAQLKRQLEQLRSTLEAQGQFAQIEKIRLRADYRLSYGQIIAICELLYLWPRPALLPLELDVSDDF